MNKNYKLILVYNEKICLKEKFNQIIKIIYMLLYMQEIEEIKYGLNGEIEEIKNNDFHIFFKNNSLYKLINKNGNIIFYDKNEIHGECLIENKKYLFNHGKLVKKKFLNIF